MPDTPETVRDLSRVTLRSNIEDIVRCFRDIHPSSFVDKIMSAIPVGSYPPRTPSSATPELIARLLAVDSSGDELGDGEDYGVTCSYRNPDGPEAVTALETLEARVKVLTEALQEIADYPGATTEYVKGVGHEPISENEHMARIARAALLKQLSPSQSSDSSNG